MGSKFVEVPGSGELEGVEVHADSECGFCFLGWW